ncbi:hypothetical protein N183_27060 [Sinorhizobium sp. Sb3]|uniref:NAD/NADP octopine/nopaline dehydrogenase family protein n=1 Tax=Sinorhizobium sp. Sb3 TaxID=1358417 RepID=UPI00071D5679|nr:NAD/NADP octopine/nopaline dehydrogenase family protein [Sinorhizobium sp. Sb3]KSV72231.1 hypothetical protein N183_27060 [Sinorhizobium sp. Sb3]
MAYLNEQMLILGAGNTGCGMAADFESRRAGSTTLWAAPGHDRVFQKIKNQGNLPAYQDLSGTFYPELTQDLGAALARARVVIVTTPATGQDEIIDAIIDAAGGGKVDCSKAFLFFNSGKMVAPIAKKRLDAAGVVFKNIGENGKSPYTSRVDEHPTKGTVRLRLNGYKGRLHVAGLDPIDAADRRELDKLFSMQLIYVSNILKLNLLMQYFIHPATMLANISPVETHEAKRFYRDLMTESVCELAETTHGLTLSVAEALGFKNMEGMLEAFKKDYNSEATTLYEFAQTCEELNRRPGLPVSMTSRQLVEDILFYAVPVVSIAKALGIEGTARTIVEGWIAQTTVIYKKDCWAEGRKLEDFGLPANATKAQILAVFNAKAD